MISGGMLRDLRLLLLLLNQVFSPSCSPYRVSTKPPCITREMVAKYMDDNKDEAEDKCTLRP